MDSLTLNLIIPFKITIIEKTHSFAPRSLIFKFQKEVLKFSDICVSWNSPKTNLVTNSLNLEKPSFSNVSISQ